jgi:thiamine pyrophosphokinase
LIVEGNKNNPLTEVKMNTKTKETDTEQCNSEIDEELADVLIAISVISKRLARKLNALSRQPEGGKPDGQDE